MTVQEPVWLRRTRPCPFFSQGRCLFADTCNFLHDAQLRTLVNQPLSKIVQVKQPSLTRKLVFDPPSVVVDSPRSVNLVVPASPAHDSSRYSGLISVLSDVIGPPHNPPITSGGAIPGSRTAPDPTSSEQSCYHPDGSEVTLDDPVVQEMEYSFPEVVGELVAEPHPAPGPPGEGSASYFVEDTGDDEYMDNYREKDPTMIMSNRQSSFSSFTGASLLASPRNSVFGESSAGSPIEDGLVDLLSPVELSAKLRPFPIPSPVKRGESIDSGYVDWVGPRPFPRSPPRNSPVTSLSHSRRISIPRSSSSLAYTGISHEHSALHSSPHRSVEIAQGAESDGRLEDDEHAAYAILGAYDTSPCREQGEDEIDDFLDSPWRHAPHHRHSTRERNLNLYKQPSFVSDDNLSFKTALSTQPSIDNLGDIHRVSPVKQEPIHPPVTGRSTPITSVLSHYSDANEVVEQSIVDSHTCHPPATSSMVTQIDGVGECAHLASPNADNLRGKVASPRAPQSHVFHLDRRSVSSMDRSHPSSLVDNLAPEPVVARSKRSSTIFDEHRSMPNSPAEIPQDPRTLEGTFNVAPPEAGDYQDAPAAASDVQVFASDIDSQNRLSIEPSSSADSFRTSSWIKDTGYTSPNADSSDYWSPEPSIVVYGHSTGCTTTEAGQSLNVEDDSFTERSSCPLPPSLSGEFVAHDDGNETVLSEAAVLDLEEDMSNEWTRTRPGSDLTERVRPSGLPSVGSVDFDNDFTLRRSRAASDITVKARSPSVPISRTPPPAPEEPGQSDSVQSLYDEYFDTDAEDCSDPQEDVALPDMSGKESSSPSDSAIDPLSDLRPLLTAQKSPLRSSLAVVPKTILADAQESLPTHNPTSLQIRGVGSTMVPLKFRRQKPLKLYESYEPREVLRIRTDIAREDLPPGYSSANQASFTTRSPSAVQSMSAPPTTGLKQLRLSTIINKRSSILSTHSSSIASSISSSDHISNSSSPHSPSVSSVTSFSRASLLSSPCEPIPEQTYHTLKRSSSSSLISSTNNGLHFVSEPSTRHNPRSVSAPMHQPNSWRLSHYRAGSRNYSSADGNHRFSRRTSTLSLSYAVDEQPEIDQVNPASVLAMPIHAIATPKPTLLFAIASDDVDQVRQVLESGEAGPNDSVGPQSALAFTLTNDKLAHKQEIVKALLAYGANPSTLRNPNMNPSPRIKGNKSGAPPLETTLEGMDPATRYFVARADAAHTRQTSQLIYRSFFRPLTRVRYDVIGQDWALEQLFRILSMHSQKLAVAPIVVLLCGPSGHGKSLLARKFGSLLDVPTHTVNMTTLQSAHDIWQSYSMSPYEEPSSCTLAEFLIENEGKRCVVVLDEIEKVEDQKALWSLLMPWELGRCSLEAGKRHVDARSVIWLGTSNIGHELVFQYHENRAEQDVRMSREDYLELTSMMRPRVSHCLGASLVSRVTTVLPFVPFTMEEKKAIAAETVYSLIANTSKVMSPPDVETLVIKALPSYHPSEGARSLHRAISNILIDAM